MALRAAIVLGLVLLLCALPASAGTPAYVLRTRDIGHANKTMVSLVSTETGRTIWRRISDGGMWVKAWSHDDRHLAVVLVDLEDSDPQPLYFWDRTRGLRRVPRLPLGRAAGRLQGMDALECESVIQLAWSPDSRRLLFRTAMAEGGVVLDQGPLYCLNTRTFHLTFINTGACAEATWTGLRTIRYRYYPNGPKHSRILQATVP